MGCAWPTLHSPPRRRCRGRLGRRMRDEKARRPRLSRGEAEAARGRQIHLFEETDDESQTLRPETFLDCMQSLARARGLDDEKARGVESHAGKPGDRWRTELRCKRPRPAPENPGRRTYTTNRSRKPIDPPDGEAGGKPDPSHPVGRRRTPSGRRRTFDFMNGLEVEPRRQESLQSRGAKPPAGTGQRCTFRRGSGPWAAPRCMSLEAQDARAEPCDNRIPHRVGGPMRLSEWRSLAQRKLVIKEAVSRTANQVPKEMFLFCSTAARRLRQAGSDKERTSSLPSSNRHTQCKNFENPWKVSKASTILNAV